MTHHNTSSDNSSALACAARSGWVKPLALGLASLLALPVAADELNGANTAWVMTSTALVLFMTLPGLALFYGGLVRTKNSLSVLMQCFTITALVSILWLILGYSLAFMRTVDVSFSESVRFEGGWEGGDVLCSYQRVSVPLWGQR